MYKKRISDNSFTGIADPSSHCSLFLTAPKETSHTRWFFGVVALFLLQRLKCEFLSAD